MLSLGFSLRGVFARNPYAILDALLDEGGSVLVDEGANPLIGVL